MISKLLSIIGVVFLFGKVDLKADEQSPETITQRNAPESNIITVGGRQLTPFSVLRITEICEDHIESIQSYMGNHPATKESQFKEAARLLQVVIEALKETNIDDKPYNKEEILVLINRIAVEMTTLRARLDKQKDTITCVAGYDKTLRQRLYMNSKLILNKWERKLRHIQTEMIKNSDINYESNGSNAKFENAINHLVAFRSNFERSETNLVHIEGDKNSEYDDVLKELNNFIFEVEHIRTLF